jgi:hypothetical protein
MSSAPEDAKPPEPRRPFIRLPQPLWIGLGAVLSVAIVIGLQIAGPIHRRCAMVAKVEQLGGTVLCDRAGPQWLRRLVRDRPMMIFDEPYGVYLGGPTIGDAEMTQLPTMSSVWQLHLEGTNITDAGLERLSKMPALIEVFISSPAVTDAGLKHLAALPRLGILRVRETQVTAEGIAELKRALPDLQVIR